MKPLISKYGSMWARNDKNIKRILGSKKGGLGVYVLFDGSMPVYVGKGKIHQRILAADKSRHRRPFWDYFSWYVISEPSLIHDVEALLLHKLPWYLRGLNRQGGHFVNAEKVKPSNDKIPRKK